MCCLRYRGLVCWITLVIILAGSLVSPAHFNHHGYQAHTKDGQHLTLDISNHPSEIANYSVTFDDHEQHGHHLHDAAHCLFCVLPGSVDALIINTLTVFQWRPFTSIATTLPPLQVYVFSELDYWHPHHALDPPILKQRFYS